MFEFDHRMMNTFGVRSMFEVLFDEHLVNIELLSKKIFSHIISMILKPRFKKNLNTFYVGGINFCIKMQVQI